MIEVGDALLYCTMAAVEDDQSALRICHTRGEHGKAALEKDIPEAG